MRTNVAKFRISNHKLMIESGRHQGSNRHFRPCPFCKDVVECEMHFLIDCPRYNYQRETMLREMMNYNPSFQYLSRKEKFVFTLTNSKNQEVASYIHNSLELRDFLVRNPKNND